MQSNKVFIAIILTKEVGVNKRHSTSIRVDVVAQQIKPLLGMPAFRIRVVGSSTSYSTIPIQFIADQREKQQMMA